jgi:site-specific recombinase XerD
MPFLYIQKKSPYYWIGYYDIKRPDGKRNPALNTRIPVTAADRERYAQNQLLPKPRPKFKPQGTKEARELLKKFSIDLAERDIYAKSGINTREFRSLIEGLDEYLYNHPKIKPNTVSSYIYAMKLFITAIGNKDIHKITEHDCSTFIRYMIKNTKSEATQNSYTKRLWVLFNYFVKKKWCNENIITITDAPEYMPDPIPEDELKIILNFYAHKRGYTDKEGKKAYQHLNPAVAARQLAVIKIMLETGFRQSTLLLLGPKDIDYKEGIVKAINVKRNNKPFIFPLHKRLLKTIKNLPLPCGEKAGSGEQYFPEYKNYDSLNFWERDLKRLLKDEMIKRYYQMYQLRDTFNSRLANAGVDEATREVLLDHYSDKINRMHYTSYTNKYLKDLLDQKLKGLV